MHQLMFERPGVVRWEETAAPELSGPTASGAAIVRSIAVALCDLDVGVLRGAYPLPGPYPLGHEGVAEVVDIGDDVTSVAVGDKVIVPFQISCGSCQPCRRGRTGNCAAHPPLSTYGLGLMGGLEWGGLLADLSFVPHADAMLVPLPENIEPASVASMSDNIADAWRCVGPQLDDDPARLEIASSLGVDIMDGPYPRKAGKFPITVDASGSGDGLRCAINSTAFDGTCTSPSVYLEDQSVPMMQMYSRCCTLHAGRAHARAAIPEALALVKAGFDPALVTTETIHFDDAEDALRNPSMKPVLVR